jgi:peptidoglycan/LPS O-acetylase OafA/YrhL
MRWQNLLGALTCALLLAACWLKWCYYPDINQYFTGFYSYKNQYGKPGLLISIFGGLALIMHLIPKTWAKAANLAIAAIMMAYAIKSVYVYVAPYDGIMPEKQFGIWLMMGCVILNLIVVMFAQSGKQAALETTAI